MAMNRPCTASSLSSPVAVSRRVSELTVISPRTSMTSLLHRTSIFGSRHRTVLHDLAAAELVAADEHGDLVGEAGQEGRLLEGGVAAADDGDLAAAEEEAVAGGAGAHAAAAELLLRRQSQPQGRCAGGDDDGVGEVLVLADPDAERARAEVDAGGVLLEDVAPKRVRLLAELLHQLRPLDAVGEAGVVLDVRGDHELAHRHVAGDDERLEVGARRRRSRRSGPAGPEPMMTTLRWRVSVWLVGGLLGGRRGRGHRRAQSTQDPRVADSACGVEDGPPTTRRVRSDG